MDAFAIRDRLVTDCADNALHAERKRNFRIETAAEPSSVPLRLRRHQSEAVRVAGSGSNCVLTTGTGAAPKTQGARRMREPVVRIPSFGPARTRGSFSFSRATP